MLDIEVEVGQVLGLGKGDVCFSRSQFEEFLLDGRIVAQAYVDTFFEAEGFRQPDRLKLQIRNRNFSAGCQSG